MLARLFKILLCTLTLCLASTPAFAEVRTIPKTENCAAGTFKVDFPKPMLVGIQARQQATDNIQLVIDKFRYQAENIGNTEVKYHVTAETREYISIFLESLAVAPEVAHGEKDAHAIVIAKKTGEVLPLSYFFNLPDMAFLRTQGNANYITVLAADGHSQLDTGLIQQLTTLPTEYFLDAQGNVYLLATEMTIYATGTPLLKLPKENFPYNYVQQK